VPPTQLINSKLPKNQKNQSSQNERTRLAPVGSIDSGSLANFPEQYRESQQRPRVPAAAPAPEGALLKQLVDMIAKTFILT
jgi:hypothetical protein